MLLQGNISNLTQVLTLMSTKINFNVFDMNSSQYIVVDYMFTLQVIMIPHAALTSSKSHGNL